MASSSSANDPLVTTQGASKYTRTHANRTKAGAAASARKHKKPKIASVERLPPDTSSTVVEPGVCCVLYGQLDPDKVASLELMRGERGCYKYVQRSAGGRFFDVTYYNAEIGKSVFLGRFVDECTASLAHALARSDLTCRTVDRAAQCRIERIFVQSANPDRLHSIAAQSAPIPSAAMSSLPVEEEDSLDFDSLFEELANE